MVDPDTGAQRPLGILMLDTRFPRMVGDIGNAESFAFPVIHKIVRGAGANVVVKDQADGLLPAFIAAGRSLIKEGCVGITTTCGFLSLFQTELRDALGVPVLTSALLQGPFVAMTLPEGQSVGILTIDAESLTPAHLTAAGMPIDTAVGGIRDGHLREVIFEDLPQLNADLAKADMVAGARDLVSRRPDIGAIVLECANMPPYAKAVAEATGRPVYSALSAINWFYAGLSSS